MSVGYTNITSTPVLVGDISPTVIDTYGDKWLLCNGSTINETLYPELSDLLPFSYSGYGVDEITTGTIQGSSFVNGFYSVTKISSGNIVIYTKTDSSSEVQSYTLSGYTYISASELFYANGYYFLVGSTSTNTNICYTTSLGGTWSVNSTTKFVNNSDAMYSHKCMWYDGAQYNLIAFAAQVNGIFLDCSLFTTLGSTSFSGASTEINGSSISFSNYIYDENTIIFYGSFYSEGSYYTWQRKRPKRALASEDISWEYPPNVITSYSYGGWLSNGKLFGYIGSGNLKYIDSDNLDSGTIYTYTNSDFSTNIPQSICFYDNKYIILSTNAVYEVNSTFTSAVKTDKMQTYVSRKTQRISSEYQIGDGYNFYYTAKCVPLIVYNGAYAYIKAE